ncbi:afadin, adherens junction formation factor [Homo sapiens]|uniref:Afadin n=1 Tax=Homo sapiens TaxID=9606 RepID=AFAD_HUMAN|nr:afadin isoform 6 [Homo sapiens]P55196.3 RecName: Full=Afadin; AltName: Full=ALL1-fused gene from chromosome 6 protein; Short=Protein AF-6; AltName: Full=Afadin adherens junction formation factor [Homo sapiens]KAI2544597.1 afadin, adherens junction formation factor [Homo sapiens]KAI4020579.1 afadin, adherens junction formation factor [Homo sapiens]|eukprot:XP_005267053.1 afadin isoform X6 [Homo sapiens]
MSAGGRDEERRKLADIIHHWNANRLDLFEISQPTEDLEFHGVMRFYFQDKAAGNFATKCIRVSSTATTQDVIETLAEKFRPDMRMLSSPKYSLYEVHVSGERRLDIDEKPLVVQLNWNKDDREGRFVLKNENDAIPPKKAQSNGPEKQEKEGVIQNFKRTLSKKEKKEKKKREKEALRQASDKDDRPFQGEDVENSRLAAEVYKDMPETSFTRTISNPEVVMKRRRQQKLEKRMQEFRSSDGRPDSGGTLRIYADSLKPNIPYKTILLSTTDPADFAVAEALEKYGLEKENPKDYCIARVMLPPGAQHSDEKGAKEIILDDDECPLQIFREWPSDKGILVFQLKRRPPDHIPKKTKKHLEGKTPKGKERADGSGYGSTLPPEKLPYLVELSPGRRNHFAYYNYHTYEDGSDSRDKPKLYRLQLSVTEVGTEKLDDNSIQLFGPGIQPHHCDLTNMDGVVTVTPRSMDAETYVEGQRISETTMLQSGMKVQFGASHVFKFVDPSQDHALAKRSVDGGLMVKGPRHKPGIVQETTFDLGGDIHSGTALPTSKSTTRLDSDRVSSASSTAERGMVKPMIRVEQQPDYRRQESRTQDASGPELILPASIEFRESSEDSFLSAIINYTNSSTVHFKLSPTYVLYMACRYVLSNQYRPDISPTERTHKVIAVVNKMVSMMEGVIQKQKNIAGALAFWMANASELLNFIKQDRDLSRITLDAQDVLAHLVQMAFKYLVHCLQSELNNYMPAFLDDPEENSLQRPKIDDVLHTLTGAMSLLRRCRVNAALTIQLFSQLFHFINMWLFNRLVTDPDSGLCSHYWGAIIRQQLGHIEAWAEKQGLELAADCHLSRIVQATTLLTMDKYAPDDIPNINSTCFKLNSLQLQALLQNYHCAPDEPFIPTDLIENVVTVAENTADELARSDGREVQLEEDPDLQLPFLLPEDGYSCDVVRNIPNGLQEFLDPLCQRGFCRLIPHTRSPGTWTIYFEGADYESHLLRENTELAQPLRKEPEIITVTLKKQNGMGLSIVAAKGAGQDKLGIYVKSVVKGGAADVDGRLAAGDQLLSVDGRSLVGLSQERAAELMTRTSSVVTLEVAKQGAIYHGLATLLNQPSPMMQRISDRRGSGKPRPKSEGFELYNNSTQNGSPESPQLPWAEYSEPKKLPGDDRLMKNRADHRSSPNVANQPPSPGGKSAYASGTTAKITSVSTGNLCTEEQTPPPRPEAYPIPTQTYTREYFTFPASKSQDRMAPPQNQWPNYEEKPHMHTDSNHSSIAIQRVTRSQEELREDKAYQLERHRIEAAMDRKSDSDMWINQSSSLDSSTSSQEHLNHSSKSVTPASTLTKSGPGRWKTPAAIPATPVAVSQPIRTDLPPPPPPPPVHYAGDFDGMSMDLPLPPPPSANQIGLPSAQVAAAERRKREEHQRWYEKEKARLEEERERKRREQERKLGQMRTQSLNPAPFSPLTAQQMKPEKPSTLQRPQETVIRELQPQQQPRTIERRDLQYITVSKEELSSGDSLSPDPWKRDAKEKLEKQQQMHIVDMLSKEIQELQSKPDRSAEESDRLRKLMLEWQFQKRLQESKQKDEDDEEEEDDDVDTMLIMQRLEAERRARLQDEERRRQQQLEEMRKREAEDRARQEEERRRQEEERTKRDAEEKRRQEEGYYSRLEAERRRQHDEAARRLLEPEAPGLCRPPLPRDYEPPSPSPAPGAPPPPPQRNASYLKTQVLSPDSLFTAKFVAYNEEEEEEDCSLAGPNSYPGSTGAAVGAHDACRDAKEKRSKSQDADSPGSSGAPENLTFKERQRLFSQGQDVSNKVKASRKLTELENELNTK